MSNSTARASLLLAPDVPDVAALGANAPDDFLSEPPKLVTADRARRDGAWWRIPLPGTPDENGVQRERPRGAGTGTLLVRSWRGSALERWRARVTAPCSSSLAARYWNLNCHLRAHGVGAPQLVAMGELGRSQSFVVVRALDGFAPLSQWRSSTLEADARERGERSLELAIDALARCGAWLPENALDNVLIQSDTTDCAAIQIANLQSERAVLGERGLERARLPAVAFTNFDGGSVRRALSQRERANLARKLGVE